MKACFLVVLFIMLYKVVLTFESVDDILKCDHSSDTEQHFLVVTFILLYKVVLTFDPVVKILKWVRHCAIWNVSNQYDHVRCILAVISSFFLQELERYRKLAMRKVHNASRVTGGEKRPR